MTAIMKSLLLTIKPWFQLTSLRAFLLHCSLTIVLMLILVGLDLRDSRYQMSRLLEESATDMAIRVARSISPTVWEVFSQSANRRYSETFAAGILDSELSARFALSIHVYASLGSVLMAREKLPDGRVQSVTQLDRMVTKPLRTGKVRLPVKSGVMTIGHIEVYYTDRYQEHQRQSRTLQVLSLYSGVSALLILLLYLLRRSFIAKQEAHDSLEQLKLAQEQLIQSEKMAGLGGLVAGLAHEINTPLGIALTSSTSSLGLTKEVQKELANNTLSRSALASYLEQMVESASMAERGLYRASDLVGHFKLISVDQHVESARQVNLLDYMEEILSTLSIELKKADCDYQLSGDESLNVVTIPGCIAQIITNLTNNALMHAFSGSEQKQIRIQIANYSPELALIEFQDNGSGMEQAVMSKVFEPFFTTKRGKGGSGLGMNIVFNLVTNKLHGQIEVESEPGQGTLIRIFLPKRHVD